MAQDVGQATLYAACCMQNNLEEYDVVMIKKIIESNWEDEEQMVSNLLQCPFLLPEDIRIATLIRGLEDVETPYYVLSAALGVQRITIEENDFLNIIKCLKTVIFNEHGAVSMRAFISLQPYLKYPTDVDLFLDILKTKKSSLHDGALSWLVLRVNDKKDLLLTLKNAEVPETLIANAEKKMEEHCEYLAHGK